MNKYEDHIIALNQDKTVTLRNTNGNRIVINRVYGTYSFCCAIYHKRQRHPFYVMGYSHASIALDYANKLGYN